MPIVVAHFFYKKQARRVWGSDRANDIEEN